MDRAAPASLARPVHGTAAGWSATLDPAKGWESRVDGSGLIGPTVSTNRQRGPHRHAAMTNPQTTFVIGGDIDVRRLGFGAMRITGPGTWGPPPDRAAARALLRRAVELGAQLIDTADAYGPGVSEGLIAEALAPYDGVLIATKGGYERSGPSGESATGELIGWTPNGRPDHLRSACEASLRRLRLDRIDLYQLHTPDPSVPYAESIGALNALRSEGKIRHIGVSNVTPEQLSVA